MKTLGPILLTLLPLLFAGCFEIVEEVWINTDGSGRIRIDIGMSEAVYSMGKGEKGKDPLGDLGQDFEKTRAGIEKHPNIRHVDARRYSDGDMEHFVFDIEVTDLALLNEVQKAIYLGEEDTSKKTEPGKIKPMEDAELVVQKRNDGMILFVRRFGQPGKETSDSLDKAAQETGGIMFGNYHYTVRVHAENIVSSNGTVDEAGKTVEWKIPIGYLMAGKAFRKEMRAEIGPAGTGYAMWVAAGVVVVGIVLAVTLIVRRKKMPPAGG